MHFFLQEAAPDADKVFMAAIDKFDAMMSKGNSYAPDGNNKYFLVILIGTLIYYSVFLL